MDCSTSVGIDIESVETARRVEIIDTTIHLNETTHHCVFSVKGDATVSYRESLAGLKKAVRAFRVEQGLTRGGLAKSAGIAAGALNAMDEPDWSPRLSTLDALLSVMDNEARARARARRGVFGRSELQRNTLGVSRWAVGNSVVVERVFSPEAVNTFAPEMLGAVQAVLGGPELSPDELVSAARKALPAGATHLMNVAPRTVGDFKVTSWDSSTGYNDGADYNGAAFCNLFRDEAYRISCEDAYSVAASGGLRFSFVQRIDADGSRRQFLRRLIPLPGSTYGPHIVAVTLPKKGKAAAAFIADVFSA